jgi:NADPH:quinone reductase-like Zn-dependent oxidoreductase
MSCTAPSLFLRSRRSAVTLLVDGPDLAKEIAAATGGATISLALDGVGGPTTQRLVDAIGLYGKVVLWTRTSGQP